jgi:hypothetical protein
MHLTSANRPTGRRVDRGAVPLARLILLASMLALLSTIAACGSSDSSEAENARARQAVDDWQADLTRGDGEAACSRLTKAGLEELLLIRGSTGGIPADAGCPQVVRLMRRGAQRTGARLRPAKTVSVRVDGDRATAQVSTNGFRPVPVGLAKQNGEWKISSPGYESPLPSGNGQ